MKITFCLLFLSSISFAQNLTPEEQKRLIEENKMLREEIKKLKTEPAPKDSVKMMEALKKGQKHQEEVNQYLEELDKEE